MTPMRRLTAIIFLNQFESAPAQRHLANKTDVTSWPLGSLMLRAEGCIPGKTWDKRSEPQPSDTDLFITASTFGSFYRQCPLRLNQTNKAWLWDIFSYTATNPNTSGWLYLQCAHGEVFFFNVESLPPLLSLRQTDKCQSTVSYS